MHATINMTTENALRTTIKAITGESWMVETEGEAVRAYSPRGSPTTPGSKSLELSAEGHMGWSLSINAYSEMRGRVDYVRTDEFKTRGAAIEAAAATAGGLRE